MAYKHVKGPALLEFWPKTASTALTINSVVTQSSGALITAVTATTEVLGVLQTTIASADTDYASTTSIPVLIPLSSSEFEVDLTNTTTFAATFDGKQCDFGDAGGLYIDPTVSSHKQVTILRQGSTTSKAIVKINGAYSFVNAV